MHSEGILPGRYWVKIDKATDPWIIGTTDNGKGWYLEGYSGWYEDSELFYVHLERIHPPSEIDPCGGCGQANPSKRCLGCLHPFIEREEGAAPLQPRAVSVTINYDDGSARKAVIK